MDFSKIKGIVFDLDGVLLDTEYYQWQGWVKPLNGLGIEFTKEDYFDFVGKRGDQIEEELRKLFNLKIEKGHLLKKKGVLLEKWFTESKINLTPFARESVEFFVNNPRVRVALCTTALKEETLLKLSKNDLLRYFPVIISGSDTKRSKPWPDIYLLAVEKLKLKPEECLAFEDTEIGLRAAKSAGLNCFVIPGEFSIKQDFTKADRILKDLKEVVDLFKENSFE